MEKARFDRYRWFMMMRFGGREMRGRRFDIDDFFIRYRDDDDIGRRRGGRDDDDIGDGRGGRRLFFGRDDDIGGGGRGRERRRRFIYGDDDIGGWRGRERRRRRIEEERGRGDEWKEARIRAVHIGLELYGFGNAPTEDEEVSDFATSFAKGIADRRQIPESKLCGSCIDIPVGWLLESPSRGYILFRHATALRESAKGCGLCNLILRSVGDLCNDGVGPINIIMAPQFLIVEVCGQDYFDYRVLRLCTDPGSRATRMGVEVGLPIPPKVGDELHFHMLKKWLEDCDEHHNNHKFASKEKELPTRVLEVRTEGSELRLRENHEINPPPCGKYIALSHRWGEDKHKGPLTTTTRDKEDRCKSISFDDLPKTFQHAVIVTRKLGIQYLWIDSLCIIQDDEEDWKKESSRMESVFANAYCTIAATSAEDSWAGFLDRQSDRRSVKLVDRSADPPFSVYVCELSGNFANSLGIGGLNRRAWVFQERALSPRTIHFTAEGTYWECGSVVRCETLIQMVNPPDLLSSSQFPMTVSGPPPGGAARAFEDIFARYSELDITYAKDRPYAIAGLQDRLKTHYQTGSTYGIIHCCFQRSLLWQRAGKEMQDDSGTESIPSWSWMKYRGGIRYGEIPTTNISWNRNIKFPTSEPSSNNQEQRVLEASVVRISPECRIVQGEDPNRKIKDANGRLVGWIRLDRNNKLDVGDLGCILVMQQKSNGWTAIGQGSWKDFAGVSCDESLDLDGLSYILLVSDAAREQGYEMEVCRRLGVAVIQADCLLSGRPRTVWLI